MVTTRKAPAKRAAKPKEARDPAVESYVAALPKLQREALERLRKQILSVVPNATQKMAYGIPTFVTNGRNLVHMAAFKNHCSFFPGSSGVTMALEEELAGHKLAKGTIQFTPEKPLPAALVKRIVKMRVAEEEARAAKTKTPTPRVGHMKAYASFDAFEKAQSASNRAVIRRLRAFVKNAAPTLRETVKWGNGCWVTDDANVAFAYSAADHVQFGFFSGSSLNDPDALLQGAGKYVRHVRLRSPDDVDERALGALLRQAVPR